MRPPTNYDRLLVVTSPRWVAEDLRAAGTIDVSHSIGLDAPDLDGKTALWCSGSWATRLLKIGIPHPFLSPGAHWLPTVTAEFLGREVWSCRLEDLPYKGTDPVFYKLAEHKHSGVPAGLHVGRGIFQRTAGNAFDFAPEYADLNVLGSEPMSYTREYRCFIAHGKVAASSFYLATVPGINDTTATITWDAFEAENCPDSSDAAAFAQQVTDAMGDNQPPGYVLDVGEDAAGHWSVIEANAAWSSNLYHAPAAGVIEAVLASQKPGNAQWAWRADALFLNRARLLPKGSTSI